MTGINLRSGVHIDAFGGTFEPFCPKPKKFFSHWVLKKTENYASEAEVYLKY